MRIIPKKTKVSTEFFRGVRLADVIVAFVGVLIMFAVFLSSLPGKLWIELILFFILGLLLVRIDDDPNYMLVLQILRHFSYERRFQKLQSHEDEAELPQPEAEDPQAAKLRQAQRKAEDKLLKDSSVPESEKAAIRERRKQEAEEAYRRAKLHEQKTKRLDIRKMTLITGISDGYIHYGSQYHGAAIEIPAIELRFFGEHRRSNAIDRALGSVIRSIGTTYAANIVKIERPLILDKHIQTEYGKIDALRRNYERGILTEDEMKMRVEIIYDRINSLREYNFKNKVLVPHFYLVLFDSDTHQLDNQVQAAMSSLEHGEMLPHRLDDRELAVFLRYTNSVDFDEREIKDLDSADYVSFILPDSLEIKGRTTEINNIITHNFRITGYPVSVEDAWGAPLFDIPGTKVMMKVSQLDREKSIRSIDRSISELTSQLEHTNVSSRILELQTHIESLTQLLALLQNNNENLMAMNIYVTAYDIAATRANKLLVPQPPPSDLPQISSMKRYIRRIFSEQGFKLTDLTFQQFEGYVATQVNAYDPLQSKATATPSSSVAAVFPWIYPIHNDPSGLNLGVADGIPSFVDFFRRDHQSVNSNMVIVGRSGSGKSYATKNILSNLAADDTKIFVLDPENEYAQLVKNLDGKCINVANSSHGRINPFQIITTLEDDEVANGQEANSYSAHLQFLEEFFRQILPEIDTDALEHLNTLINRVYLQKGIDRFTNLWDLSPEDYPIFDDLYDCILEEFQRTNSDYLRSNLRVLMNYVAKFSTGGRNASMWNGPSNLATIENFIVFNFQTLLANRNNTIANAQMLLVLKYLDNEIIKNRDYNIKYGTSRKIIVVIDEAHVFIDEKYPLALDFMYQLAKRIRKYNGMQIVITQNIKDFVGSEELARKSTAIINACQYSFIFSLAPNDMHDLCTLYEKAGGINSSEQEKIVSAKRGEAFFITGPTSRTTMEIVARKTTERIFTEDNYQSHYFNGENGTKNWEDVIGPCRSIRQNWEATQSANQGLPVLPEETPLPRFGGVRLVEVEASEPEIADAPAPEPPAPQAVEPAAPEQEPDLPELLKRFSYDALVNEIRRTVRQELEAELGQRQSMPDKPAPAFSADHPDAPSEPAPVETPSHNNLFKPAAPSPGYEDLFESDAAENDDLFQPASPTPEYDDPFDDLFAPASDSADDLFDDLFAPAPAPNDDLFGNLFSPTPDSASNSFDTLFTPPPAPENDLFDDLFAAPSVAVTEAPSTSAAPTVFTVSLDELLDMPD